ncbi:hypothetical protein [Crocinitomix algicola]|uniref:hypothetical protein n=1 Tax=Crocinitomix algicola TaxID=1740263 RepID=UPI0008726315|nr:hypothetical protein [Crocinitomix algicola]
MKGNRWSDSLSNNLSNLSEGLGKEVWFLTKRLFLLLQSFRIYFNDQIQFLRSFEYSKKNIENHFMQKAARFFGFEWTALDLKRKNKNWKKRIKKCCLRYIDKKLNMEKRESSVKGFNTNGVGTKNIYRPPS